MKQGSPTVVYMAPGSLSNVLPEDERLRRRAASWPMVEFCGDVATYQYENNKFFMIENPESSQLWNTEILVKLQEMSGVHKSVVHMCAYGLKDPASGLPMKKPMTLLHNIPLNIFAPVVKRC